MRAPIQQTISIPDLLESRENIAPLLPLEILATPPVRFDLSRHNSFLRNSSTRALERHISDTFQRTGFIWGYGGWAEERHPHPSDRQSAAGAHGTHVIHLGIDIWVPAGTSLFAPMAGKVHSFKGNGAALDYGPTVVTEHTIGTSTFYILYGHLSRASLEKLKVGSRIRYGDPIGAIGGEQENGCTVPHLHLQLISNMQDKKGAFPGVARSSEKEQYLSLCPNPEALLKPFLVA